jgi:hypothetical protein
MVSTQRLRAQTRSGIRRSVGNAHACHAAKSPQETARRNAAAVYARSRPLGIGQWNQISSSLKKGRSNAAEQGKSAAVVGVDSLRYIPSVLHICNTFISKPHGRSNKRTFPISLFFRMRKLPPRFAVGGAFGAPGSEPGRRPRDQAESSSGRQDVAMPSFSSNYRANDTSRPTATCWMCSPTPNVSVEDGRLL